MNKFLTTDNIIDAVKILDSYPDNENCFINNQFMPILYEALVSHQKWYVDLFTPKGLSIIFTRSKS